jgi:hypothetical protein
MPLSGKSPRLVLESFVTNGRYALRQPRKSPGFALGAIHAGARDRGDDHTVPDRAAERAHSIPLRP